MINQYNFKLEDLKDVEKIKSGYSRIYVAHWRGKKIIVKRVDPRLKESFDREYNKLKHLSHPNVVELLGICNDQNLAFALEFATQNLTEYWKTILSSGKNEIWIENRRRAICFNIIQALQYIHRKGISHLDLKPDNILMKGDEEPFTAILCDFGDSKTKFSLRPELVGTLFFMAPEILNDRNPGPHSDIFSFGVCLYFLLGNLILPSRPKEWLTNNISRTPWAVQLIKDCCQEDPNSRLTADALLQQLSWKCKSHSIYQHTIFISYRQRCDLELAKNLALDLERYFRRHQVVTRLGQPITVFLDQNCLNDGEDWTHGFIGGIQNSQSEILVISKGTVEDMKKQAPVRVDNVLKEWEESLLKSTPKMILTVQESEGVTFKPWEEKLPDEPHNKNGKQISQTAAELFKKQVTPVWRNQIEKVFVEVEKWLAHYAIINERIIQPTPQQSQADLELEKLTQMIEILELKREEQNRRSNEELRTKELKIQELSRQKEQIRGLCCAFIETMSGRSKVLDLSQRRLNDVDCEMICSILKSVPSQMKFSLNLSSNNLGASSGKSIGEVLKDNLICKLYLNGNQLEKEGCKFLGEALERNTSLVKLDLSSNEIGTEGAFALIGSLSQNTTLRILKLVNNNILLSNGKPEATTFVHGLRQNKSLQKLKLMNSKNDDSSGRNDISDQINNSIFEILSRNH